MPDSRSLNKIPAHNDLSDVSRSFLMFGAAQADTTCADINWLERNLIHRAYRSGDTIVSAGTAVAHVGVLQSGIAILSRTQDRGTRQIVGLLHPGDFLGTPRGGRARFDIAALTLVETNVLPIAAFERLVERVPGMQQRLFERTLQDVDAARMWTTILARRTARQKLASLFVHFSLRQNTTPLQDGGCRVDMILTREQVADLLSLTFETVSRQISSMVSEGVLVPVTRRIFDVADMQALLRASGDDSDGGLFHG